MPSGRTHDRITLMSLPWLSGGVLLATRSPLQALLFGSSYLFGGLMLSPDLDIHSLPYKRWGPLRWIWLPYRWAMQHRSMLSHGPIFGTVFRLLYLGAWLLLFGGIGAVAIAQLIAPEHWQQLSLVQLDRGLLELKTLALQHPTEALVLYLGLELGCMSHALSDWSTSAWKRLRRKNSQAKAKHPRRK